MTDPKNTFSVTLTLSGTFDPERVTSVIGKMDGLATKIESVIRVGLESAPPECGIETLHVDFEFAQLGETHYTF